MSATFDITGPAEVEFIQDYLRPICDATINFRNNYLIPFREQWGSYARATGGDSNYSNFSDSFTAGFSQGVVYDGFSGSHWYKLTGEIVDSIASTLINISEDLDADESHFLRAAARSRFSTETIDIRNAASGTGGWVSE
jgi:hypothetical protein